MGRTVKSKITAKYQTTVPKLVREELGLGPSDYLQWEVHDGEARVAPANHAFLSHRSTIQVGPGSVLDDIRSARQSRGHHPTRLKDLEARHSKPAVATDPQREGD